MSPYKPQHEIRCAHCKGVGAANECPDCRRQICRACAGEADGCPARRVERHSFGRFNRVLAISGAGSHALVSFLGLGRPRLVRLAGAPLAVEAPPPKTSFIALLRGEVSHGFSPEAQPLIIKHKGAGYRAAQACACSRHIARIHRDETVSVSRRDGQAGEPREALRGRVLEFIAYDCNRRRLAIAIRGSLHEFACDAEHRIVRRESSIKLAEIDAPAALSSRDGVVSLVASGLMIDPQTAHHIVPTYTRAYCLRTYRSHEAGLQVIPSIEWTSGASPLARTRGEAETTRTYESTGPQEVASPPLFAHGDAGNVALALDGGRVLAANAVTGAIQILADHQNKITFVGFAGDRLATADSRGHLYVRTQVATDTPRPRIS